LSDKKGSFENILTSLPLESVGLIQLNRPTVLNALDTQTLHEVVTALDEFQSAGIRVVILTGNDKAFAAGADIKAMVEAKASDQIQDERENLWRRFNSTSIPIIAAVNGFCLGGGNELAMACDFIIAGDSARFGQPEINIATTPGAGGTQRLTRALGKSRASYYCLTGEMFSAQEALAWGLVAKVVPARTLIQEAKIAAKKIAEKAPLSARLIKEGINASFNSTLEEGLKLERRNFYLTFALEDQKEGMKAFLEKRKPHYKGQ